MCAMFVETRSSRQRSRMSAGRLISCTRALFLSGPYRLLNIVDDCTGESLAIVPAFSFGSADVIRAIERMSRSTWSTQNTAIR